MKKRKTRVGVSGHDLKFWTPIQLQLEQTGDFDFRIDEWSGHADHDEKLSRELIEWADVLFAEWALGNAVFYSRNKRPDQKLVIRWHLQERRTSFPNDINYGAVDDLVFVGAHILGECVEKFSIPPEKCRVVGNLIEHERFNHEKLPGHERTLGMIGVLPARKRLDLALDTLELLVRADDRFRLRIKGQNPAAVDWLWQQGQERDYYVSLFKRINASPVLRHRVIFDPAGKDVEQWLRLVGSVLSPSDFESFHVAVAEGVASAALPVVWNWEGAGEIYPGIPLVESAEAAAQLILAKERHAEIKERALDGVKSSFGPEALLPIWRTLLTPINEQVVAYNWGEGGEKSASVECDKSLRRLKVALICDEFTYNSFKGEFVPVVLEPGSWRERMESERPELLFCESAWSGVDSETRPWKGRVYASSNFTKENRGELLAILDYCKEHNIPTAFWNKEDPSHYEDKVHDFVSTAKLFDVVFTTASECVERYKKEHGVKNAYCLPFATQPRYFNPIEVEGARSRKVVFAGSWYAYHQERCKAMEAMLDKFIEDGLELEIYDRHFGTSDKNHIFPQKYHRYLKAAVPHAEIGNVYKSSQYGLNFNTETSSPTMFARRVYELMSSNTLCVSNYSKGMDDMFGDLVFFADRESRGLPDLGEDELASMRDRALHHVLREHTYKQRFRFVAEKLGVALAQESFAATVCCIVACDDDIEKAIAYYQAQNVAEKGAPLLLVLDRSIEASSLKDYYETYNRNGVTVVSEHYLLSYANKPGRVIETDYLALVDYRKVRPVDYLEKAVLHTSYAENVVIVPGSDRKYVQVEEALIEEVIAPASFLPWLMKMRGRRASALFYLV